MFQIVIKELGNNPGEATKIITSMDINGVFDFLKMINERVLKFKRFIKLEDNQITFLQELIQLFQTAINSRDARPGV